MIVRSPARGYSAGHDAPGYPLPGQVRHGENSSVCDLHPAESGAQEGGPAGAGAVPYSRAGLSGDCSCMHGLQVAAQRELADKFYRPADLP